MSTAPVAGTRNPAEQEEIQRARSALRLGWALSELRGRLRESRTDELRKEAITRVDHALPLGNERTRREQAIEVEAVVKGIAKRLEVDIKVPDPVDKAKTVDASYRLEGLARELEQAHDDDEWSRRWNNLTEFLYHWDAKIQDALATTSFLEASAYQLGRGLADISWALDHRVENDRDPRSWGFLLGDARCELLHELLGRLGPLPSADAARREHGAYGMAQRRRR